MFEQPSQEMLGGGDHVADESEELESCKIQFIPMK
jgi:hypothetical protein